MDPADNPYRPPRAELSDAPRADRLLEALRDQSTWRLLGLSLITYGVYAGYYCRRQGQTLNAFLPAEQGIGDGLLRAVVVLNWISLALLLPTGFVEEGHPVEALSSYIDLAANLSFIAWGFAARRRMNPLLQARRRESAWFHGFWTFLFSPFYFNYKVNVLGEEGVVSPLRPEGVTLAGPGS